MKIYGVFGTHWYIPGERSHMCETRAIANHEAANMVQILRDDIGMAGKVTANTWEDRLIAARNRRARQEDCHPDELGNSDAEVYIIEYTVLYDKRDHATIAKGTGCPHS